MLEAHLASQSTVVTSFSYSVEGVAVRALLAAASARDRGTDDHSHRIVQLAEATARELGLSEEEQRLIGLAALLHDIGKIGIPDAILHKPGPLSDDEWIIMRRHPEIGQQILEQAGGMFGTLTAIVVAHHERWDGEGYPVGLKGEEIPIGARILSVVDSYDAMTSSRPYRESFSVAQARAELQRCAGYQYDPRVVEAFLAVCHAQALVDQEKNGNNSFPILLGITMALSCTDDIRVRGDEILHPCSHRE